MAAGRSCWSSATGRSSTGSGRSSRPAYDVQGVERVEQLRNLDSDDAAVLILGPSETDPATIYRVGVLTRSRPGLGALIVVSEGVGVVLRTALRAGIDDAVELQNVEAELLDAVDALWRRIERELAAASAAARGAVPTAKVTTVFSPKGGVGKSVVGVNLAAAFARKDRSPVAILDLDLQFGDVAVMFRLQPAHTIVEAAAAGTSSTRS